MFIDLFFRSGYAKALVSKQLPKGLSFLTVRCTFNLNFNVHMLYSSGFLFDNYGRISQSL